MKKSLFTILCVLLFSSCEKQQKPEDLIHFIPNDATVIIQTSNLKYLQQDLNALSFLKENSLSAESSIQRDLSFLKFADSLTESIISLSISKNGKFIYTIISKQQPHFQLDSIQNKSVENINAEGLNYKKLRLEENEFFATKGHRPFIISNSEIQLRQILKKESLLKSDGFVKAFKAIAPNKTSLIINHAKLESFQKKLFPNFEFKNVRNYAGWSAVDLEFSKKGISFNGLSISTNKTELQQIFRNTAPISIEFPKITPQNSGGFIAIGFKNSEKFLRNLKEFKQDSLENTGDRILLNIQEAGIINAEENPLFAIKTLLTTEATDLISGYANLEENYRHFPIYKVSQPEIFESFLSPIFSPTNIKFAAAIDQYLVFGNNIPQLRELIADFVNKYTLVNEPYYKENEQKLAQESSILIAGKTEQLQNHLATAVLEEFTTEMKKINFGKHKIAILQLVEEDDFAHIHGSFEWQNELNTTHNKTEEILSVSLEAEILNEPVLVKNHLNNQMDIAVQDIENTLYLISNRGTIFWKKKLSGPILGKIKQVDLFKNGKFQLAFATSYSIEVLDRNGNTVKPFPLKFKDEITQPLSLFDYDNNRRYRFLITQNDEVFMYDKNGKSVRGFDFRKANSQILKAPKHIRIQNKDYIVFPDSSGKLNILSRQGDQRVNVKENIDFSDNQWYEFENNFISTNTEGNLVKVKQNGSVNIEKTNFSENHSIAVKPNLLISLSENILKIKDKDLSLDYGLYTAPEIFYVNDKYYISLTDLQTQKVFVFNSNANLLPGFPVYGTSGINLNNADIDQRPEFVVKGGDKEVLMYKH